MQSFRAAALALALAPLVSARLFHSPTAPAAPALAVEDAFALSSRSPKSWLKAIGPSLGGGAHGF